ncbi:hypothetical protein [Thiomonas intermedia]|uniref:hypothetical protein n=1 Tax=Thiomonas intermedia TaxID=926 RepID=UPI0009A48B62|nr:hypothetical protein [Thiomonas intermedia]
MRVVTALVTLVGGISLAASIGGCGRAETTAVSTEPGPGAAAVALPAPAPQPAQAVAPLAGRTRTLTNPDKMTMVYLYNTLAGIPPPIDQWVEDDRRVSEARPADKAAQRLAVRAEIAAGLAAVRDIGRIRFTLGSANLSDYDPTYKEFTVGALSPSSQVTFQARRQTVNLQFTNGEAAQHWSVPPDAAQAIRDRVNGGATLEVLVRITGVQPGADGGAVLSAVEHYELRARDGTTLARVDVPAS